MSQTIIYVYIKIVNYFRSSSTKRTSPLILDFLASQSVLVNSNSINFPFRCVDKSQFFPPGRSIWCNNRTGPTARPTSNIGGHACCGNDYCNEHLKPILLDYQKGPVREYTKGGIIIFFSL